MGIALALTLPHLPLKVVDCGASPRPLSVSGPCDSKCADGPGRGPGGDPFFISTSFNKGQLNVHEAGGCMLVRP